VRPAIWLLLVLLPVCVQAAPTRYQILADTTTIKADDLLQVLGRADIDSAQIDTLYGTVFMPAGSRLTAAAIDADSLIGAFISTGAGTFNAGIVVPDGQRVTAEAVDADSLIGGTIIPAGVRLTAAAIDADSLINAVRLTGLATFAAGLTVPAAQTVTGSAGSIFDLTAVTPDSILGTVLATGVFNISTATNWQLGSVAYTGSMANLNSLVDSLVASYAWRSKLTASDGSPNPAVQADASGNVGIGVVPYGTEATNTALYIGGNGTIMGTTAVGAGKSMYLGQNFNYDTDATFEYISTDEASVYTQNSGEHCFYVAPSGTAGTDITWTQAMTLTNAGQLLVGHTASVAVNGATPEIQANGGGYIGAYNWTAGAGCAILHLGKSRSATKGTMTIVQDNDLLGAIQAAGADGTDLATTGADIVFRINGTPAENDIPGEIELRTYDGGAQTGSLILDAAGKAMLNGGTSQMLIGTATASANAAGPSLLIAQGANDDKVLLNSSTDVAHGMTALVETNVYGAMAKVEPTSGGLSIFGYKDADGTAYGAIELVAYLGEAADTTHTSAGLGVLGFYVAVKDGTTASAVGANGNLFCVRNLGSTKFIVDAEGDLYADGSDVTVYDEYDDVQLVRAFDLAGNSDRLIRTQWDEYVKYREPDLVKAGILGAPRSEGGLVCITQLQRLHNGAIWQSAQDIYALEAWRDTDVDPRLAALERRVNEQAMQLSWRDLMDTVGRN